MRSLFAPGVPSPLAFADAAPESTGWGLLHRDADSGQPGGLLLWLAGGRVPLGLREREAVPRVLRSLALCKDTADAHDPGRRQRKFTRTRRAPRALNAFFFFFFFFFFFSAFRWPGGSEANQ